MSKPGRRRKRPGRVDAKPERYVSTGSWWKDFFYFVPRHWRWHAVFTTILCLVFIVPIFVHVKPLRASGRETVGRVLHVRHRAKGCSYTYAYQVNGHTYEGSEATCGAIHTLGGQLSTGASLVVVFDPSDPSHSIGGPVHEWDALAVRMIVLVPLFGLLGLLGDFVKWRRSQ